MASRFRLFTRRFFIYTNILIVFFYLLACLTPFLNPENWWFISFFGLLFPFLLFFVLLFLFGWIIARSKFVLLPAIALLIGYKSLFVFFAFKKNEKFNDKKDLGAIRVVSWNVARFIELLKNDNEGSRTRIKMMELLKEQNADVLCLQEFQTSDHPDYYNNIEFIKKELGFPYFFFTYDEDGDRLFYSSIIFSRFRIIDSGRIRYPRPTLPDVLIHADIKVYDDTLRIYTTHLQSLQFRKSDYEKLGKIKRIEDSILHNSRTIASKLKWGSIRRSVQANIIRQVLDDSPFPVLFCADLNDVPNSYTYFAVRGTMQDAFLKKGFGIGRTYSSLSPTLRIDYIFADARFRIHQYNRIVKKYSDHYMLVADVSLKK